MSDPVVAVALSGGVDSLVAGFMINQAFKHVFGIHFTTGYEKKSVNLENIESQLGFPVHTIDLARVFEKEVVDYFISTYLEGKTPNPCLMCNQKIKFGSLLEHAKNLGAKYLATGHYATIVNSITFPEQDIALPWLEKGLDPLKDQSYFLARLSPKQLDKCIFPLAGLTKHQVRQIAHTNNLVPASPGESQDICFVHDNDFSGFINRKKRLVPKPGNIMDMNQKIIGVHKGLHTFTIGQRRGINCPGPEPYYVRHIDIANNTLNVCFKADLAQTSMHTDDIVWNYHKQVSKAFTKIRYSHKGAVSQLIFDGSSCNVVFEDPQLSITPGQAAVFYKDARVLGSGIIQ